MFNRFTEMGTVVGHFYCTKCRRTNTRSDTGCNYCGTKKVVEKVESSRQYQRKTQEEVGKPRTRLGGSMANSVYSRDAARGKASREQPVREKASREQPVREKASREQPVRGKPAREQPVRGKASREQPVREQPVRGKPARGKASHEEPAYEEPAYEEPAHEEPAHEEPAEEEPDEEEHAGEEHAGEEHAGEEFKYDKKKLLLSNRIDYGSLENCTRCDTKNVNMKGECDTCHKDLRAVHFGLENTFVDLARYVRARFCPLCRTNTEKDAVVCECGVNMYCMELQQWDAILDEIRTFIEAANSTGSKKQIAIGKHLEDIYESVLFAANKRRVESSYRHRISAVGEEDVNAEESAKKHERMKRDGIARYRGLKNHREVAKQREVARYRKSAEEPSLGELFNMDNVVPKGKPRAR